jgi:hypothetical protein
VPSLLRCHGCHLKKDQALAQLWNVVERANNQVLSGFSENEKQQLTDFLQRIQVNCAAMINA